MNMKIIKTPPEMFWGRKGRAQREEIGVEGWRGGVRK